MGCPTRVIAAFGAETLQGREESEGSQALKGVNGHEVDGTDGTLTCSWEPRSNAHGVVEVEYDIESPTTCRHRHHGATSDIRHHTPRIVATHQCTMHPYTPLHFSFLPATPLKASLDARKLPPVDGLL